METRLFDAVEMIAASTWATEAVLRALERGDVESAGKLLEDARRPLRRGLRDLRMALDESFREAAAVEGGHDGAGGMTAPVLGERAQDALAGVARLEELVGRRVA